jgi:hypothetical protein
VIKRSDSTCSDDTFIPGERNVKIGYSEFQVMHAQGLRPEALRKTVHGRCVREPGDVAMKAPLLSSPSLLVFVVLALTALPTP